jgi:xanthine dehydrogenase accessory factor
MYAVTLGVTSCLKAGTRVDVVWTVRAEGLDVSNPNGAVALTPGGGRMGSMVAGALDQQFSDLSIPMSGRLIDMRLSPTDALIAGLPVGSGALVAAVPASTLPSELWQRLAEREAVALVARRDGNDFVGFEVHTLPTDDTEVAELLGRGTPSSQLLDDRLITVFAPVTTLAISGGGPIVEALGTAARALGWQVTSSTQTETAIGLMSGLSRIDAAVVMGHDVESSSRVLGAAVQSDAGYIGALGSQAMQQKRADWLAYQDVTDLSRVHGPAGFHIGANTPAEIAISILAEAIGVLKGIVGADVQ